MGSCGSVCIRPARSLNHDCSRSSTPRIEPAGRVNMMRVARGHVHHGPIVGPLYPVARCSRDLGAPLSLSCRALSPASSEFMEGATKCSSHPARRASAPLSLHRSIQPALSPHLRRPSPCPSPPAPSFRLRPLPGLSTTSLPPALPCSPTPPVQPHTGPIRVDGAWH